MTSLPDDPAQDPLVTTAGMLVEAAFGFNGRFERDLARECGLSLQWFEVLMRLLRTPGHRLRMSDLAAQTTLSASGLTRAVDRLVDAGFVIREACPTDKRGAFAVLTPTGHERISAAVPVHLAGLRRIFEVHYTPAEVQALTELLRRLRDVVNPAAALASVPHPDDAEADAAASAH